MQITRSSQKDLSPKRATKMLLAESDSLKEKYAVTRSVCFVGEFDCKEHIDEVHLAA